MKRFTRDDYYTQANNSTEQILKVYHADAWLVSCGPTAMINCIAPFGGEIDTLTPRGRWNPQPEDVVVLFLADPRNAQKLDTIRPLGDEISEHEVPQYYPYAASELFGATARFEFIKDYSAIWRHCAGKCGGTAQLCLISPGHYIAVVDADERGLIYNDPHPGRHDDGNGYRRVMDEVEYNDNVQNYAILYGGD